MNDARVAIVHEWLSIMAGSERVLEQLCLMFPDAELFCTYADPAVVAATPFLRGRKITTTFIQQLPGARKWFRHYLPLMPLAVEQLDMSGFDLVISSTHAVAKGVLTGPDQLHISYVHSPIRYAWDLQHQYLRESKMEHGATGWIAKWLLHKLRIWDVRTASGVDDFVANSEFIARRIHKVYGRSAKVIHPPVAVTEFSMQTDKEAYYLTASRLAPYKRMDVIVEAFVRMPDKRLLVVGDGPEMANLTAMAASHRNIEILGFQPFESLKRHMQGARAFVFAAEEDFGIAPVEAQACGTPVIAFGRGGALETIVSEGEQQTGVFFGAQTAESVCASVAYFESTIKRYTPRNCRLNAERFSAERFRDQLGRHIGARLAAFEGRSYRPYIDGERPAQ
jgi:glycosyltransferase involved in cell wall biosynthesis